MSHKLILLLLTSVDQAVNIKVPSNAGEQLAGRGNTNQAVGERNSVKLTPCQSVRC